MVCLPRLRVTGAADTHAAAWRGNRPPVAAEGGQAACCLLNSGRPTITTGAVGLVDNPAATIDVPSMPTPPARPGLVTPPHWPRRANTSSSAPRDSVDTPWQTPWRRGRRERVGDSGGCRLEPDQSVRAGYGTVSPRRRRHHRHRRRRQHHRRRCLCRCCLLGRHPTPSPLPPRGHNRLCLAVAGGRAEGLAPAPVTSRVPVSAHLAALHAVCLSDHPLDHPKARPSRRTPVFPSSVERACAPVRPSSHGPVRGLVITRV